MSQYIQKIVCVDETTHKIGNCFDVIHRSQSPIFCFPIKSARVDGAFKRPELYLLNYSGDFQYIASCKVIWISESRKHLHVESGYQKIFSMELGILLFGILNPGLGMWNPGKLTFWNPLSWNLESSTWIRSSHNGIRNPLRWNLESSTWDSEFT